MATTRNWSTVEPTWAEVRAAFDRENAHKTGNERTSYVDVAARLRAENESALQANQRGERDLDQPAYEDVRRQVGRNKEAWEQAGQRGKQPTHQQAADELAKGGKTLAAHEQTATTADLRREIEREPWHRDKDGQLHDKDERALAQLDALDKAGVHRIERPTNQSAHVAIGDAYTKSAARETEFERGGGERGPDRAKGAGVPEVERAKPSRKEMVQDAREVAIANYKARADVEREGFKPTISTGAERTPEPSTSAWAKKYDVERDTSTGHVVYSQDGVEKIRDKGRDIEVRNDPESIKDAVTLAKDHGCKKIDVLSQDPEKRQAVMREAYRQNVGIETHRKPEVEGELREAVKAVEQERSASRSAERVAAAEQTKEARHERDGAEIEID